MFDRILVYFSFIKCGRLAFEKAEVKDKFESELNYSLYHWRTLFAFIVPSLIGALLFMTPLKIGAAFTIPIAAIAVAMQTLLSSSVTSIVTVVVTTTALMSIAVTLFKPKAILRIEFFRHLLDVSPIWLFTRFVGMVFVLMTYFQFGPETIRSENTGFLVLNELMPVLFSVFILAGLLLPLLLNFGLFEFVGTLLTKVMRPLFGVPSLSAVNCVASWVGDGSVGILMTSKQYEEKFYTQKEAAIIGTTFSSVSIAFCLVVIGQVNLEHLFAPFYLTVCVAGVVAALILPRLPPLRFIPFLKLLQIPEAQEASKSIVVGFADMFIPSILAANSIELFSIFLLRTLVTLPVIAAMAHWLL